MVKLLQMAYVDCKENAWLCFPSLLNYSCRYFSMPQLLADFAYIDLTCSIFLCLYDGSRLYFLTRIIIQTVTWILMAVGDPLHVSQLSFSSIVNGSHHHTVLASSFLSCMTDHLGFTCDQKQTLGFFAFLGAGAVGGLLGNEQQEVGSLEADVL
ncbi:hypothetical protein Dimus_015666 [Dionaea muscipula]